MFIKLGNLIASSKNEPEKLEVDTVRVVQKDKDVDFNMHIY